MSPRTWRLSGRIWAFKGRRYFGEFASASAVAAVAAVALLERGAIPAALAGSTAWPLRGRGILLLGLGATVSTLLAEPA